jgi:hypothetical protein
MALVLFLIFFVVIFGLAMRAAAAQTRKSTANLQALAQRLGLVYRDDKSSRWKAARTVAGQQAGREVIFYEFTTGSGKSKTSWRAVSVRPRTTGSLTFNLHRQGLGSRIEALFGTKEATVGDAAFDAAWFLQTNDPDFLGAALVPEVRAKLSAAMDGKGHSFSFRLANGVVRYAEGGNFSFGSACARLEQMLPVLHDLADIAEVAAGNSRPAAGNNPPAPGSGPAAG